MPDNKKHQTSTTHIIPPKIAIITTHTQQNLMSCTISNWQSIQSLLSKQSTNTNILCMVISPCRLRVKLDCYTTVRGKQLNQQHCNSQNNPHSQGERVHGDARSRASGSGGSGGGGSGGGDIPTSNIHLHDVSVITLKN